MNIIKSAIYIAAIGLTGSLLFSSCKKDEDKNPIDNSKPYVMSLAVQGSDGNFTYYTVPFENLMEGSLSAKGQGIEQPGYYDFLKIDKTIYSVGGLDDVNVVAIQQSEDATLKTIGDISFSKALSDVVQADKDNLLAIAMNRTSNMINFYQIAKNTLTITKTTDRPVNEIRTLTEDEGLSFTGIAVVDDKVYVSYYVMDNNTFATNHIDEAEVAIYSYPALELITVIKDSRVGPLGGFNIKNALVKDENGNIFAISHSNPANGYSQFSKPSGILKINKGASNFDADYYFDVAAQAGGGNAVHVVSLGGGRAFAEINTTARADQEAWSDSELKSAVLDLNAKTVHFINDIPKHNGNGRRLPIIQEAEYVYISIPKNDKIWVYKINTQNYTAEQGAAIEANFVAGMFKF